MGSRMKLAAFALLAAGLWLSPVTSPARCDEFAAVDALHEVNAVRARRGLRAYVRDEGLLVAARNCCTYRARYGMEGHTSNDFGFVPAGSFASAAGCAAWHGNDWGSCCTYESWTYAGAAWCRGRDGRRYMHLFVR